MTKSFNQRIWSNDQEKLKRIAEDFEFIGRKFKLERGLLTVFALPQRRNKKKEEREKRERDKGRDRQ